MGCEILDQLNNLEKEVDSEVTKTRKSRKKKTDNKTLLTINEGGRNDIKRQERKTSCMRLIWNSKQYLEKEYTERQINETGSNYINILSNRYESVLSAK